LCFSSVYAFFVPAVVLTLFFSSSKSVWKFQQTVHQDGFLSALLTLGVFIVFLSTEVIVPLSLVLSLVSISHKDVPVC
jgi:hypothetical protein